MDGTVDYLLEKSVNIVKDKEIATKIPTFSLVSTVMTIKKAINMRSYKSDPREDDIYINAEEGEEMHPPPDDNIGRTRKVNAPDVVEYHQIKKAARMSNPNWFKAMPTMRPN